MWTWTGKLGRDKRGNQTAECRCSCGFVSMVPLSILHRGLSNSCSSCATRRNIKGEPKHTLDLTKFPPLTPKVRKPKKDYPETEQGREIKELLKRARQGDTAPLLQRVQELARVAAGLNFLWDADADDVAQETALTVLKRLDQIDEESNVFGWVFLVARNLAKDHRHKYDAKPKRLLGLACEGKVKVAE